MLKLGTKQPRGGAAGHGRRDKYAQSPRTRSRLSLQSEQRPVVIESNGIRLAWGSRSRLLPTFLLLQHISGNFVRS